MYSTGVKQPRTFLWHHPETKPCPLGTCARGFTVIRLR